MTGGVKTYISIKIVGINLLVMILYNVLCNLLSKDLGFAAAAVLIGLHTIACFITGVVLWMKSTDQTKSNAWQLSALLVLLIGFATCWKLG